ncbi:MAG: ATP-binding protein [Bacteroidales bacterium]
MNTPLKYFIAFLLFFLSATFSGHIFSVITFGEKSVEKFQETLDEKYELLDKTIDALFNSGKIGPIDDFDKKGIIILIYKDNQLTSFTNNNILFPNYYDSLYYDSKLIFNNHAWYALKTYDYLQYKAVGWILIKKEFSYKNKYLENEFQSSFKIPASVSISEDKSDNAYEIRGYNGEYLFSLVFNNELKLPWLYKNLAFIFFLTGIILFLVFINTLLKRISDPVKKNYAIIALVIFMAGFRLAQTIFRFPAGLYSNDLFSPVIFANSELLPSLGDLLLNTVCIFYIIIKFDRDFFIHERFFQLREKGKNHINSLLIFTLILFFFYSRHIFSSLITNSNISFEVYKITSLNIYSFVGLIIIGMHFAGLVMLINKATIIGKETIRMEQFIFNFSIILILAVLFLYFAGETIDPYSVLFFFLLFLMLVIIRFKANTVYGYGILVLVVLVSSVYIVYFISATTIKKDRQNMKILVENLANEHDPIAELLFEEMSEELNSDSTLADMLFDMEVSYTELRSYLKNNYFKGFWGKYDFRFYDCRPIDSVVFKIPDEYSFHCYNYFGQYIGEKGMILPNSKFYFIDNTNGRINYLGIITYFKEGQEFPEISLFLELESTLVSEEFGYPELLLDSRLDVDSYLGEYAYAKYYQNNLITQSGEFHYSLARDIYGEQEKEYSFIRFDNYDHLIYNVNDINAIILSKPTINILNSLISFSYIFVFYYVCLLIVFAISKVATHGRKIQLNFKNKIQFAVFSILLLSLVLIGGGTIYFSLEQYQKKNFNNITEKIQSVYIELDHKLAYENKLDGSWSSESYSNLDQLLQKFADVFYTDINLYDQSGDLIATSRPEIFDRGLTGTKMNPLALNSLMIEKKAEFVHRENIGKLHYLSAYVPYINANNNLLAYLNLPYFTREAELRQEITNLAVAIVNIYSLLILLTIAVAVFISDTITKPLRLLQEKFSQVKLLKDHELIEYSGSDEVASLVQEYNRMVQELQKSAELLAKSERESAWREMARQIAHEIKNPLTPMRLTIQHLQRTWKDKNENYAEIHEKVTQTLIEQIDNLSKIASEFSNFAQMPKAKNQKLDIEHIIRNTISLFSNAPGVTIGYKPAIKGPVYVFADKEQLARVFINLFKNAVQSVPEERACKILVTINIINGKVLAKVEDNGRGIHDDVKTKLFTPNFTTKSSGMGLGLAITKDIIENIGGRIYFETSWGKGTVFFVELPEFSGNEE